MTRWLCALVTGGVVSAFAFLLLTGQYLEDGPVILRLSPNHGVHEGDLFVVAGWVFAVLALGWLTLASPPSDAAAADPSRRRRSRQVDRPGDPVG